MLLLICFWMGSLDSKWSSPEHKKMKGSLTDSKSLNRNCHEGKFHSYIDSLDILNFTFLHFNIDLFSGLEIFE